MSAVLITASGADPSAEQSAFELHSPGHAATPPSPKPMPHLLKELQRERGGLQESAS